MKVFFGSAIQGAPERGMRAAINAQIINAIKAPGHIVVAEHTASLDKIEAIRLLNEAIGPLPKEPAKRIPIVRKKLIAAIEGDIDAAVFEVSLPSSGTGIEVAHAYLRPRLGLKEVPILLLYQQDYWQNGLSSMIKGLPFKDLSNVKLVEYQNPEQLNEIISNFLSSI
jgi:hypothetical protein